EGRPIFAITLTSPTNPQTIARGRVRVLFICGQHGDEPSSVTAMLNLAEELSRTRNSLYRSVLERVVIVLVPVANPDGFSRFRRLNGRGVDLNRDWSDADQPETAAISKLVSSLRPQVVVDAHEWLDSSPWLRNNVEVASFGQHSQYKLERLMAGAVAARLSRDGVQLDVRQYHDEADDGLAHRHLTNQGICSFLVETSPNWSPKARMRVYKSFASALLVNLAFPPSEQIASNLRGISNAHKAAGPAIAALYAPERPNVLPPSPVELICLAVFTLIACSVIRCTVADKQRTEAASNPHPRTARSTGVGTRISADGKYSARRPRRGISCERGRLRGGRGRPECGVRSAEFKVSGSRFKVTKRRTR
ncbi:MAG: DUF2817 domain-containing protein, partial [Armatimonadetes bacterium]|nr:DUF2817 domain-containing protein [Armatimonadota bacterium]